MLQVEQLHLLNTGKNLTDSSAENYENRETEEIEPSGNENYPSVENGQELDLRPINKFDVSEEFEEEDDNEEQELFPENSADFDYL